MAQRRQQQEKAKEQTDRAVPHNLEAERALLGSVFLDRPCLDTSIDAGIESSDFFSEANRLVFNRMLTLAEKSRPIDLVSVTELLNTNGELEKAGGAGYISQLTDGVPIGSNGGFLEYCRIVKEKSRLRRLMVIANNAIARCYEGAQDAESVAQGLESEVAEMATDAVQTQFESAGDVFKRNWQEINSLFDQGLRVTGIETGLVDLDNMTAGFQPGDLVVIAARPSLGKTALALNISCQAAIKNQKKVGFFSLEMSKQSLVMRLICSEGSIDGHKLRTGFASREDWNRLTPALGRISGAPIYIDDTPAASIERIRSRARRLKADKGLDLIVVDYMQLVIGKGESRNQQIGYVSRNLKAIAKELKIPVIALSQLSRRPDERNNGEPQLSDLRESGDIEQDADVVIFIFKPRKPKAQQDDDEFSADGGTETHLIIGKQRNGPIGRVPVIFLRPYGRFENKAHEGMDSMRYTESGINDGMN